jgi:hypothetical protein
MGMRSRRKGRRAEQEVVSLARNHGLVAQRTWHTAQAADAMLRCCDVTIEGRTSQVKVAATGFKTLYDALAGVEMALLRTDRHPWLAVVPAEELFRLLASLRARP